MLAHCTTCEESFELNFRGSTEQFLLQGMDIIKLHLRETNGKKELKLCFPSLMPLRGVRMKLKGIRLKEIFEKTASSHYTLEHENGKILLYIDRNHESMGIFILESITVLSSMFLLLRLFLYTLKY